MNWPLFIVACAAAFFWGPLACWALNGAGAALGRAVGRKAMAKLHQQEAMAELQLQTALHYHSRPGPRCQACGGWLGPAHHCLPSREVMPGGASGSGGGLLRARRVATLPGPRPSP